MLNTLQGTDQQKDDDIDIQLPDDGQRPRFAFAPLPRKQAARQRHIHAVISSLFRFILKIFKGIRSKRKICWWFCVLHVGTGN